MSSPARKRTRMHSPPRTGWNDLPAEVQLAVLTRLPQREQLNACLANAQAWALCSQVPVTSVLLPDGRRERRTLVDLWEPYLIDEYPLTPGAPYSPRGEDEPRLPGRKCALFRWLATLLSLAGTSLPAPLAAVSYAALLRWAQGGEFAAPLWQDALRHALESEPRVQWTESDGGIALPSWPEGRDTAWLLVPPLSAINVIREMRDLLNTDAFPDMDDALWYYVHYLIVTPLTGDAAIRKWINDAPDLLEDAVRSLATERLEDAAAIAPCTGAPRAATVRTNTVLEVFPRVGLRIVLRRVGDEWWVWPYARLK